ncbi:thiamine-phosphate kinase [Pseudohongiella spirulinae]|uniref:Thiamine-monophosphate kinase n=1 Tax=Pseudohongiella spirulinae TaxID=1249552 RepID=A0A0S2KBN7_9GAMM|nr:thiamine-phosphate kinase [Pseudohongiella spirulinae]ALO45407.1 Thiamine-monophosphate kinase [Pseudohongiella spirulinae]
MALTEFELIARYFAAQSLAFKRSCVALGQGDDGALLQVPDSRQLVLSVDTLNASIHFPEKADAFLLGQRCLLVNLSDLAAMGAEPVAFTLALSLPEVDTDWLEKFSRGLAAVAGQFNCPLIGGDTTRGPLSITIQAHGLVETGQAILRSGARPGDDIYVTGTLGDAAVALWQLQGDSRLQSSPLSEADLACLQRAFYQPDVRVELGRRLAGIASAGLDISDGLASDLRHILKASAGAAPSNGTDGEHRTELGAVLNADAIPLSDVFTRLVPAEDQLLLALTGGDDYELCICASPQHKRALLGLANQLEVSLTLVGQIVQSPGLKIRLKDGQSVELTEHGYQHFS